MYIINKVPIKWTEIRYLDITKACLGKKSPASVDILNITKRDRIHQWAGKCQCLDT